jgi:hypothetical protein
VGNSRVHRRTNSNVPSQHSSTLFQVDDCSWYSLLWKFPSPEVWVTSWWMVTFWTSAARPST